MKKSMTIWVLLLSSGMIGLGCESDIVDSSAGDADVDGDGDTDGDGDGDTDGDTDGDSDTDGDGDTDGDSDAPPFNRPGDIVGTWAMQRINVGEISIVGQADFPPLPVIPVDTTLDYDSTSLTLVIVNRKGLAFSARTQACKLGADPKANAVVSAGIELPTDLSSMPVETRDIEVSNTGEVTMPTYYSAIGIDTELFDLENDSLPAWGSDWSEVDYIVDVAIDNDDLPGLTSKLTASIVGNPLIDQDVYTVQVSSSSIEAAFKNRNRITGTNRWAYDISVQKHPDYATQFDFFTEEPGFTQSPTKSSEVEMIRLFAGATCGDVLDAF